DRHPNHRNGPMARSILLGNKAVLLHSHNRNHSLTSDRNHPYARAGPEQVPPSPTGLPWPALSQQGMQTTVVTLLGPSSDFGFRPDRAAMRMDTKHSHHRTDKQNQTKRRQCVSPGLRWGDNLLHKAKVEASTVPGAAKEVIRK